MFNRFTDRAKKVMQLAREAVLEFRHDSIGTEHLLLGLLREGTGVGANVLKDREVDPDALARVLASSLAPGTAEGLGKVSFSPEAQRALQRALEEAAELGHDSIGTEHLLLGLIGDDGVAGSLLQEVGITVEQTRRDVRESCSREDEELTPDFDPATLAPEQAAHATCLCGAVTLTMRLPPLHGGHCHCDNCRRAHGAGSWAFVTFPLGAVAVTKGRGHLRRFVSDTHAVRRFCQRCGSMLTYASPRWPDHVDVSLANVNEPLGPLTMKHAYADRAPAWAPILDDLPRLGGPSGTEPL